MNNEEGKKFLTFEEILEQGNYVICDSSLNSVRNIDWYWRGVYPATSFSEIDADLTERQIEDSGNFVSLLRNNNVYTVLGIREEIERIRNMVSDNIKFLEDRERFFARRIHRKKFREGGYRESRRRKELLEEIRDLFYEICVEAKRKTFHPENKSKYKLLERIVLEVTKKTGAKIDYEEYYHGKKARPKNTEDLHTDERIVATALYLSNAGKIDVGILTRDSDMKRILINTLTYVSKSGSREFLDFLSALKRNRIRVYYATWLDEALIDFDTSEIDSYTKRADYIPPKLIKKINGEVLKGLNENPFLAGELIQ